MKNKLLLVLCTILFFSCLDSKYDTSKKESKIWVYLEIETVIKKDTTPTYIYGQIKKSILQKMQNDPNASGVFFVDNTRFINDDDLLQVYADRKDTGLLGFRIEEIKTIDVLKKDPIRTFDENELHESSKKVFKNKKIRSKHGRLDWV